LTNAAADERGSGDSGISVASHRHQQVVTIHIMWR
jgi:hypothetical protein